MKLESGVTYEREDGTKVHIMGPTKRHSLSSISEAEYLAFGHRLWSCHGDHYTEDGTYILFSDSPNEKQPKTFRDVVGVSADQSWWAEIHHRQFRDSVKVEG